nr:ABC-2 family transporter protein [Anabaena sp. PCC 7108]
MKRTVKKALTLFSVYYAYMLEYRSELILWILSGSLPIILMGVWIQAAQGGKFGFTSVEFARYFFAVFLVRQSTVVWVIYDFEKEVVEGKLSPRLLQPLDPGFHHFFTHVAERFARMPFVFILIGLFFLLYPQAVWLPSLANLLLFTLATISAFSLRFLIQYTFAMFAFWTERATAIESFWFLFFLFLSGMIAPLEIFPEAVRNVVMFTPFPYLINFPASILVGLPVDLTRGFLSILGWLLVFLGANRLLWRAGLKRYSGMGA